MTAPDGSPPVVATSRTAATQPSPLVHDLAAATELAPGRCQAEDVERLEALQDHVLERLALGDGVTVVAVAGGTGVGKSALVNRLVGTEVVVEGVRRPTTDHAVAVAPVLDATTARLLDWLGIDDRRVVPAALPDGLVLVDLPDHDSVADAHRTISERLAARVDVLLVVVDPVKYARADLHEGALASLRAHAEVLTVVLNREDELAPDEVTRVRDDLRVRLADDGLERARVVTTSAATGRGVPALGDHLAEVAGDRRAAVRRLEADAAQTAAEVLERTPVLPAASVEVAPLVDAALEATDAYRALAAAEVEHRSVGRRATRSPLARLARVPLHVTVRVGRELGFGTGAPAAGTRQLPPRSQELLTRRLAEQVQLSSTVGASHTALDRAITAAAATAAPALVDEVRTVTAPRVPPQRRWWTGMAMARLVAESIALVGLVWLLLLAAAEWLALPTPSPPALTEQVSWPAGLLLGGVLLRALLGLLTRRFLRIGARRARVGLERQLRSRLATLVADLLVAPYAAEVAVIGRLRGALERLVSGRP
jgi:GTP-binding protein EngB required for normal cell division